MAEFGLKIINDSGYVQIDSNFRNWALKTKATVTCATSGTFTGKYGSITVTNCVAPQVFWDSSVPIAPAGCVVNGSTWTFYFFAPTATGSTTATFTAYVFDLILAPSADQFGLRVWDAAGNVVFDSGLKYMKVVNAQSNYLDAFATFTPVTVPAGKVYAVSAGAYSASYNSTNSPITGGVFNVDSSYDVACVNNSSGSIVVSTRNLQHANYDTSAPPPRTIVLNASWSYLTLDVTDY